MRAIPDSLASQRVFESSCAGKEKYPSEEAANAAIKACRDMGLIHNASHLAPYPCNFCAPNWHFGH